MKPQVARLLEDQDSGFEWATSICNVSRTRTSDWETGGRALWALKRRGISGFWCGGRGSINIRDVSKGYTVKLDRIH